MANTALVVGGLAIAGGVAYVLYQKYKAAQKPQSDCDKLCTSTGDPGGHSACVTACNVAAGVGQWVGSQVQQFDGGSGYRDERARRQTVNDTLNGLPDVANPNDPHLWSTDLSRSGQPGVAEAPVATRVLRYANGCVPLYGSPGFAKCKAGTQDMYSSAIDQASGKVLGYDERYLQTDQAFPTLKEHDDYQASINSGEQYPHVSKDHAMTGLELDPTTAGPWAGPGGQPFWFVRGKKVSCPAGQAPRQIMLQKFGGLVDLDTGETCVDATADPRYHVQTSGVSYPCVPGGRPSGSTGFSFDAMGKLVHGVPCAGSTGVSTAGHASHSIDLTTP